VFDHIAPKLGHKIKKNQGTRLPQKGLLAELRHPKSKISSFKPIFLFFFFIFLKTFTLALFIYF